MVSRGKIPGTDKRGYLINLGKVPKDLPPILSESGSSEPTVLLAGGSGMGYPAYKGFAASYLIRGMNVMMIDFRGYGESEGSPTDHKTYLDLETAYQYLKEVHHVENKDILVHGHCQGAGPGSNLAGRRKDVNLLIDRSFADYSEMSRRRYPLIGGLIAKIMPSILNYNNAENLKKVTGHTAIVFGTEDEVIPDSQIDKLIESTPATKKTHKIIEANISHTGMWADNIVDSQVLDAFLDGAHLRRKVF